MSASSWLNVIFISFLLALTSAWIVHFQLAPLDMHSSIFCRKVVVAAFTASACLHSASVFFNTVNHFCQMQHMFTGVVFFFPAVNTGENVTWLTIKVKGSILVHTAVLGIKVDSGCDWSNCMITVYCGVLDMSDIGSPHTKSLCQHFFSKVNVAGATKSLLDFLKVFCCFSHCHILVLSMLLERKSNCNCFTFTLQYCHYIKHQSLELCSHWFSFYVTVKAR